MVMWSTDVLHHIRPTTISLVAVLILFCPVLGLMLGLKQCLNLNPTTRLFDFTSIYKLLSVVSESVATSPRDSHNQLDMRGTMILRYLRIPFEKLKQVNFPVVIYVPQPHVTWGVLQDSIRDILQHTASKKLDKFLNMTKINHTP